MGGLNICVHLYLVVFIFYMEQIQQIEQKFQRFFIANFPVVKNFARMLLKSEEDAEDVAQDVFIKLWTQPELWIEKDAADGYIYQMTKNMILNRFKHIQVEKEYQDVVFTEGILQELEGENHTLDRIYYKDVQLLIQLTLESLPEKRRNIFKLSRFMHLSNKEIAERLDLSVRTVEHQIYLVLSELKKKIFLLFF